MERFDRAVLLSIMIFTSLLLFSGPIFAEQKTFIKEYTYQASEADSKLSSRVIALEQVKRLLLEELGTYLMSETEIKNSQLTKDQVVVLTGGITKTEILIEKWDGARYYLKAKITADPDQVSKAIQKLSVDTQKTRELEEAHKQADDAIKEIDKLRKELEETRGDKNKQIEYSKAVNALSAADWFKKGIAARDAGNLNEAIQAYSRAIEINPDYEQIDMVFSDRARIYSELGNHTGAIADYSKAITYKPNSRDYCILRGAEYSEIGNYQLAVKDYDKVIELDIQPKSVKTANDNWLPYILRAHANFKLGETNRAIEDFTVAINYIERELSRYRPKSDLEKIVDEQNMNIVKELFGELASGIKSDEEIMQDNKAELAECYYNRGVLYYNSRNYSKAIADYKTSANLGNTHAQDFLSQQRIAW